MDQHEIISSKQEELLIVANAMLSGKMNLIEGVRRLCALRFAVGESEHKVFIPIRAVESETDHFPIGDVRLHCSSEYLKGMDEEMEKYLLDVQDDILLSCKEIIQIFSNK